ncbi:MAG: hypothetical protein P4L76_00615 [Beijerinckiaceae bacterium]|nr:hypothetical protein [Beijerinckiaceae bacterium]
MQKPAENLIGIGLYTAAEAGGLLQIAPSKIARWLRGHDANGKHYSPLWAPQVDLGDEGIFLGFRDLQEVRVAAAFIDKGLSPQRVRQAIERAREIIERSLTNLDYDEMGVPSMWWPLGRATSVALDPARSFGQPIEAETSVPVAALAAAVEAEGSKEAAAKAWDVPVRAINHALAVYREMDMRQAA